MKTETIKKAIAASGKSQREIAGLFGLSPQAFNNKIARGSFSDDELEKLAEILGMRYICRFESPEQAELQAVSADLLAELARSGKLPSIQSEDES